MKLCRRLHHHHRRGRHGPADPPRRRRGGKRDHHHHQRGVVTSFIAALCFVVTVHVGHGLLKCLCLTADEFDGGRFPPLNFTIVNHSMIYDYVYDGSSSASIQGDGDSAMILTSRGEEEEFMQCVRGGGRVTGSGSRHFEAWNSWGLVDPVYHAHSHKFEVSMFVPPLK